MGAVDQGIPAMSARAVRRDAMEAAVFWLSHDYRFRRAMRAHYGNSAGQCEQRCGRWPCLTFELANAARGLHEARIRAAERDYDYPKPPLLAVKSDRPFLAAIEANATSRTVPLRAVSRTPLTASGESGSSTAREKMK